MPEERWKSHPEAPNYLVSDRGRVWSKPRTTIGKDGRDYRFAGRYLKLSDVGHALIVTLWPLCNRNVGRVVLETFGEPCPPGLCTCHINGDYRDNRVENVRWGTHVDYGADMIRHGRAGMSRGEINGFSKLTEDIVRSVRLEHAEQGTSYAEMGRRYGVSDTAISAAVRRKRWKHVR